MSDLAEIIQLRLAEAAEIEAEWAAMSYKDRAAWWMSAKWYGYMSAEAYRRGDPLNPEISCRYGEPGFFIATRVPYYEAQAAVSTIVASVSATSESAPVSTIETPPYASAEPQPAVETATNSEPVIPASAPAPTVNEAVTNSISEIHAAVAASAAILDAATAATSNANSHKKKKKKHHNNKPANPGEGKTIEIRVGGQSK